MLGFIDSGLLAKEIVLNFPDQQQQKLVPDIYSAIKSLSLMILGTDPTPSLNSQTRFCKTLRNVCDEMFQLQFENDDPLDNDCLEKIEDLAQQAIDWKIKDNISRGTDTGLVQTAMSEQRVDSDNAPVTPSGSQQHSDNTNNNIGKKYTKIKATAGNTSTKSKNKAKEQSRSAENKSKKDNTRNAKSIVVKNTYKLCTKKDKEGIKKLSEKDNALESVADNNSILLMDASEPNPLVHVETFKVDKTQDKVSCKLRSKLTQDTKDEVTDDSLHDSTESAKLCSPSSNLDGYNLVAPRKAAVIAREKMNKITTSTTHSKDAVRLATENKVDGSENKGATDSASSENQPNVNGHACSNDAKVVNDSELVEKNSEVLEINRSKRKRISGLELPVFSGTVSDSDSSQLMGEDCVVCPAVSELSTPLRSARVAARRAKINFTKTKERKRLSDTKNKSKAAEPPADEYKKVGENTTYCKEGIITHIVGSDFPKTAENNHETEKDFFLINSVNTASRDMVVIPPEVGLPRKETNKTVQEKEIVKIKEDDVLHLITQSNYIFDNNSDKDNDESGSDTTWTPDLEFVKPRRRCNNRKSTFHKGRATLNYLHPNQPIDIMNDPSKMKQSTPESKQANLNQVVKHGDITPPGTKYVLLNPSEVQTLIVPGHNGQMSRLIMPKTFTLTDTQISQIQHLGKKMNKLQPSQSQQYRANKSQQSTQPQQLQSTQPQQLQLLLSNQLQQNRQSNNPQQLQSTQPLHAQVKNLEHFQSDQSQLNLHFDKFKQLQSNQMQHSMVSGRAADDSIVKFCVLENEDGNSIGNIREQENISIKYGGQALENKENIHL